MDYRLSRGKRYGCFNESFDSRRREIFEVCLRKEFRVDMLVPQRCKSFGRVAFEMKENFLVWKFSENIAKKLF